MNRASHSARWKDISWGSLSLAQRLHVVLEDPSSGLCGRLIAYVMLATTVSATLALMLQTDPHLEDSRGLFVIDIFALVIFLMEYLLRFAVCDAFNDQTRWEFFTSPGNINDLISSAPTVLLDMVQGLQTIRVLRAVRILRIFRIFSLTKYSEGMSLMLDSLVGSTRSLSILGLLLGIGVMLFSSLLFHAERLSCPDVWAMSVDDFAAYRADCKEMDNGWSSDGYLCCDERGYPDEFFSIAVTFWWCLVTMTTVGYGDFVPRTSIGRVVAITAMIVGIVLISLPVAIVGSRFHQKYMDMEMERDAQERLRTGSPDSAGSSPRERKPRPSKDGQAGRGDGVRQSEAAATVETSKPGSVRQAWPSKGFSRGMSSTFGQTKSISSQDLKVTSPRHTASPPATAASTPRNDEMSVMRARLDSLELSGRLPMEARKHLAVLQELFEHLDRVNGRLSELQIRDRDHDRRIHHRVMGIAREFSAHVLAASEDPS